MKKQLVFLAVLLCTVRLFSQPVIDSFEPSSRVAGSLVTIKVTRFGSIPDSNIFYFGSVKAIVSTASESTLDVIVPPGALYAPITVTTNGLTSASVLSFNPTFEGSTGSFHSNSFIPKTDLITGRYPHSISFADF